VRAFLRMDRAYSLLDVKSVSETATEWVIDGIASTPTPDRMGDIVEPLGAKFKTPMPLLWQHDSQQPVGRVEFAKPTAKGIPYRAHLPKVAEPGRLKDRIDEAVQSIRYRVVAAVSIGFRALANGVEQMKDGGLRFKEWEWLELSLVTIPANAEASITSIKSLDTALRAASGHTKSDVTAKPGGSGTSTTNRPKGNAMKTLQVMREERDTKSARMKELTELFKADGHETTDEESAEFDTLETEIKSLDIDIKVARFHATEAAHAKSVNGQSSDGASQSRSGMGFVRKTDPDDKFKGQAYTRFLVAKAASFAAMKNGSFVTPAQVAEHRWGKTHPKLVSMIKAAVAGGGTGSGEWGEDLADSDTRFQGDFIEYLYGRTLFDRLPLRSIPARVHVKGQDGASTGYWVGESKAIPPTTLGTSDVELTPLKVGAISVCSMELVEDSSPSAEMLIRDSIVEASAQRVDTTFLSATAASAGVSPAGLLNGLTALVPSGADAAAVRADYQALIAPFIAAKNATGLVHVMSPSTAIAIAMMVNSLGQTEFPDIMEEGGSLFKRPVYTGDNVAGGDWLLLKPSDIWKIGDSGIRVSMTDSATVEMNDAAAGASDTPVAMASHAVSLWQTESIGFKVVRRINYAKRRSGAVVVLSNAEYGGVMS
jgi:HK97 family phage major capsid protein/HK97 family phage prohead protease